MEKTKYGKGQKERGNNDIYYICMYTEITKYLAQIYISKKLLKYLKSIIHYINKPQYWVETYLILN